MRLRAFVSPALLIALTLASVWTGRASAEVTRFEILARETPALGGREFGERGQAEEITARATIALDPSDPKNAVIADLDRAPRNAQGRVEAVTDVIILRPARPNGTLLFEVLNRGRKLVMGWTQNVDAAAAIRLERAEDAGNGFFSSLRATPSYGRAGRPMPRTIPASCASTSWPCRV